MSSMRQLRLQERIKQEVAAIIAEMKDPRVEMVSVVRVELSGDLEHARVYVSTLGRHEQLEEMLTALKRAQGHVRTRLGQVLDVRKLPELNFRLDESMAHGQRIAELLREAHREDRS